MPSDLPLDPAAPPAAPATGSPAASSCVDLAVLGPVVVRGTQGETRPGGSRVRALLAALAVAQARPVAAHTLTEDLWWDDDVLVDPRAALQTLVSRTRRMVAPGLLTSGPAGYAFVGSTDLQAARDELRHARAALAAARPADALAAARAGLAWWRSEPGADLDAGSPVARALAAEAGPVRSALEGVLLDAALAAGDLETAETEARARLTVLASDETAALALVRVLGARGETNEALRVFAAVREALADELGADPGPLLLAEHEHLLRAGGAGGAAAAVVPAGPSATADGAPAALDPVGVGGPAGVGGPEGVGGPAAAPSAPAAPAAPEAADASSGPFGDAAGRTGRAPHEPARRSIGLRAAPNVLVGRDDDVRAVEARLLESRLVTVLGPGGLGKTRLAQEVARRAADAGAPLVVVVELASVRTDEDVALALASALGVRDTTGTNRLGDQAPVVADDPVRVVARLAAPGTLLVLDNCEHVLAGASTWVADVLALTPARVLTTSRAPLALAAEAVYPLPVLASAQPLDGAAASVAGPAVVLFEQRARAARPDVDLPRELVARLCDRLDGLPLAIELAAARARSLSIAEIDRRLGARFALLTSGDRSAPQRHRTLHAVIEWSWNLLGVREQEALRRLAVFPDDFGLDAAVAVASVGVPGRGAPAPGVAGTTAAGADDGWLDALDALDGLVVQSMLTVVEDAAAGTTRYRMLETVREFATIELDRAGEASAVREAVYDWALGVAAWAVARLRGAQQRATLARLRAEQDNLVQVLRWALDERRGDVVAPVYAALAQYWLIRGALGEMATFGTRAAEVLSYRELRADEHEPAAWVFLGGGSPVTMMLDRDAGLRAFTRLRRLVRRSTSLTPATRAMAQLVSAMAEPSSLPGILARLRADDDWYVALMGSIISAQVAENEGRGDEAFGHARHALELARAHDDAWGVASAAQSLAELAAETARPEEVLRWVAVAREQFEGLDADQLVFQLDVLEAHALVAVGRGDEAEPWMRRTADTPDASSAADRSDDLFEAGDRRVFGLAALGQLAASRGDVRSALDLIREAMSQMQRGGVGSPPGRMMNAACGLAVATLEVAAALAAGREPVVGPAETERWARDVRAATRTSLGLASSFIDRPVLGMVAVALGGYLWTTPALGRVDDGLDLLALASVLESRQDPWSVDRARHRAAAVALHGVEAVEAAERRVRASTADPLDVLRSALAARPWAVS